MIKQKWKKFLIGGLCIIFVANTICISNQNVLAASLETTKNEEQNKNIIDLDLLEAGEDNQRNDDLGNMVALEEIDNTKEEKAKLSVSGNEGNELYQRTIDSVGEVIASGKCGENLTWEVTEDGTLTISGTGEMEDYSFETGSRPWDFYRGQLSKLVINDGVTSIGDYAFSNGDCFRGDLIIPDSVTSIGNGAFWFGTNFTGDLVIPDSVIEIGDSAFKRCSGFTGSLTIGNSVTSIGQDAFWDCGFTENLTIGNSITNIDHNMFVSCKGFKGNLVIGNKVTSIADEAFAYVGFTGNLVIPDSVKNIGESAFRSCTGFTGDLVIPDSVENIGLGAFYDCSGFTGSLVIGNRVTSVGAGTFYGCSGFTGSLVIPDSVTSIGAGDFFMIGGAFEGCSGFTGNLIIGNSVISIERDSFKNCSGFTENLVIPDSVLSIGESAFSGCYGFTGDLIIGNSVTSIGEEAFYGCYGFMGNLMMSDEVTEIGGAAFRGCTGFSGELTIPSNVIIIGNSAFSGCKGFTGNLIIPDTVTSIESGAFDGCEGLTGITMAAKSIGSYAFSGCINLSSVTMKEGLESIKNNAFLYCPDLKDVYYTGNEEQWKNIKIEDQNNALTNATIHYESAGSGEENFEFNVKSDSNLTYSSQNGYSPNNFNLGITIVNSGTTGDSIGNEEINVTIELSSGISFEGGFDVLVTTLSYGSEASYPIYITTTELVNEFVVTLTVTDNEIPQQYTYSIPVIKENDSGINVRSTNVYVGEKALVAAQVLNDGSFSGNDYKWTSSNEGVISVVSFESNTLGDMIYFFATVKGEGTSSGEATITITFSDGRSASCLIKNLGSKPKQESPSYQVQEKKEGYDLLQDYGDKWTEAYNEYVEKVKQALKEYASSDEGNREAIIASKAKEMKQNDSKSRSKYLNFEANFPTSWKDNAYNALARFLCENTCSKMDFNSSTDPLKVVNTVFNALSNSSKTYEYGDAVMMVDCFQFSGVKTGTITCYNKKQPNKKYLVAITSTVSECKEVINDYYKQLSDMENAAIYNVYTAVAQDILGQPISKFTEKWLKTRISKYVTQLNAAGVGNLCNDLITCCEYYQFVGKITQGDMVTAGKLLDTMAGLKFEDTTITNRLVKNAAKKLDKAGQALHQAYIDYINGDLKENALQKWWRTTFSCPVSISVWNSNGEQIGYVGDDDIWYTNTIYIEERGNAVIIDSYMDDNISFDVMGTDYGIMGCSVEEYAEGDMPIGRINFYDIPLEPDVSVSFALPDSLGGEIGSLSLTSSGGEDIPANEYISASQDAGVMLNCTIETNDGVNGDAVFGAGTYVRGDAAVLVAVPQSEHRFIGWYQNDILLATSEIYEFTARESIDLKAVFTQEQENVETGLLGDVNGDGSVNVLDNKVLYNHIEGISVLDGYNLSVADVNGDGSVNVLDNKVLYNHIEGIFPLW